MANELVHATADRAAAGKLTQSEFDSITAHRLNSQAIGDIIYASSATQLSRLGIGATNAMLNVVGGIPAWTTGYDALASLLDTCTLVRVDTEESTQTFTGSGSSAFGAPDTRDIRTGITTGSIARATWSNIQALGVGAAANNMNWDKDYDIYFFVTRAIADANVTAYARLLTTAGHADLAASGIGVAIVNMAMSLESYGSSRATSGSFAMTTGVAYRVHIKRRSGRIDWYVDGVAQTAQITAANIPSGNGGVDGEASIGNGAGTANSQFQVGAIIVLKKI